MPNTVTAEGQSSVVAGPYLASWNGLALGQITTDGYELSWQNSSYAVTSDMTGEGTVTDQIYNGTSVQISFTLQHWNAYGVEALVWWMGMGGAYKYKFGHVAGMGMRHWDAAKALLLESCLLGTSGTMGGAAGTSSKAELAVASNIDPLDIVFPKALLSNARAVSFLLSSRPRYIPITLDIFPYSVVTQNEIERVSGCTGMRFWEATRNPKQPHPGTSAFNTAIGPARVPGPMPGTEVGSGS